MTPVEFGAEAREAVATGLGDGSVSAPLAIDADALGRLIRSRLREVTRRAIEDTLAELSKGDCARSEDAGTVTYSGAQCALVHSKPLRDLIEAVAALVSDVSALETRSVALVSALVRDALSYTIADAFAQLPSAAACKADGADPGDASHLHVRASAAYEALARVDALRGLTFPEADGQVVSGCSAFAEEVRRLMTTFTSLGSAFVGWQQAQSETASIELRELFQQIAGTCERAELEAAIEREASQLTSAAFGNEPGVDAGVGAPDGAAAPTVNASGVAAAADLGAAYSVAAALQASADPRCADRVAAFIDALRPMLGQVPALRAIRLDDLDAQIARAMASVRSVADEWALRTLLDVVERLAKTRVITREDVVALAAWAEDNLLGRLPEGTPRELLAAVLDAVPQAVIDVDGEGSTRRARLDVPTLATELIREYSDISAYGLHLHATIGTGYLVLPTARQGDHLVPTLYEQLGLGMRLSSGKIGHSVHLVASGLLFQVTGASSVEDSAMVTLGYSLELYDLIDVSLDLGASFYVEGTAHERFVIALSLQLPLIDYFAALSDAGTDPEVVDPEAGD